MIKVTPPIEFEDFHTLDFEDESRWWARLLCFQVGESCAGLLLQHHISPIQGIHAGAYAEDTEMVIGLLSGSSPADLGMQIKGLSPNKDSTIDINVGVRRIFRLLSEGELDEISLEACEDRQLKSLIAGTHDEDYAEFISGRFEKAGYTRGQRQSDSNVLYHVWTKALQ